ncbi:DNA (cytosine-5-)-methyltransferase [Cloacibacillus evryensis]|uniref:DNA cytosine methyltransferase n=1 Tax=Cloacibacillus evryensis TaxID=508460 RepID=UPI002B1EA200|nr:DNA (cytosine-5-)-methyltransferase [Cloacibacillus evryensis]MEA5034203.1 DNA (cytosine-5-)-methyltransferase [Cloacibacillus evryensis]
MGLIIDLFAGGGGTSLGIERALGRSPDIAINHDPEAVAMHRANHPATRHYCENVWAVNPREATKGQPVDFLWASPDCKHFSKAKGGKPRDKKIRALAWVIVKWAAWTRPRVVAMENVEEFQQWGPLDRSGRPIKGLAGTTFNNFVNALRKLGYKVSYRELKACDYGAPTIRKRFFLIARCDGAPIVWPAKTHGVGTGRKYRTAAECIDWAISCPSIFDRDKPLAENTMKRIAKGVVRYVLNNPAPYITRECSDKAQDNKSALCAAFLAQYHTEQKESEVRGCALDAPLNVVDSSPRYALCSAALITKQYTSNDVGSKVDRPLPTITASDHNALTECLLVRQFGTSVGQPLDAPANTVMPGGCGGKTGLVAALLQKYYGSGKSGADISDPMPTVTAKDRIGLVTVTVGGVKYAVADIGMRMLQPRELFRAQGFGDDYIIDPEYNGKPLSKSAQVRMCGNSVCPPVAEAIVRANCGEMAARKVA